MAERGQAGDGDQEFTFTNVQLFKNETLGTGSYGFVCKAKCDQLMCAAKLIWPALLQMAAPDPGKEHRQPFRRFESECQFLSRINHPNVVQYLGTYHDPETSAAVLLMELMDESLTHYLQSSAGDIPYHIQVNLASDIVQALAFLHANGIIHRDLSSNNVLLIAGNRAKVTDFGMLKFTHMNATRLATMTTCPGTPAFMSPEALNEPPVYTDKLDNFSFGVLLVQIMTRQFPEPSDRFEVVQIPSPRNPGHTVEAQVAIPEVERRQAHISLIEPTHLLRPIALECLKDSARERPSSQQLCQSMDALKRTARYEESSQQDVRHLLQAKDEQICAKDEQIRAKDEQLRANQEQIRVKDEELQAQVTENRQLTERLDQATQDNQAIQSEAEAQERQSRAKDEQLHANQEQIRAKHEEQHTKLTENCQLAHENQTLRNDYATLRHDIMRQLRTLNQQLESNEAALQQTIAQRDRHVSELRGMLTSKNEEIQDLSSRLHQVALHEHQATPTSERRINMAWESLPDAPVGVMGGSSTVIGDKVYFYSGVSDPETIHEFNSSTNQWASLRKHPLIWLTIVSVDSILTTVGGWSHSLWRGIYRSNKLYSFSLINRKWVEHFPPMSTKRETPAAVYANNALVVAGGHIDNTPLDTVEVLNTQKKQWSRVSSLPFPASQPSTTICGDHIYLHTFYGTPDHETKSVLKCSLRALVESKPSSAMWENIAPLPVYVSTLATINSQLLAVGGSDHEDKLSNDIHQYDPTTNTWQVISQLSIARYDCLTASLPCNKLLVVGGYGGANKIEMATVNY